MAGQWNEAYRLEAGPPSFPGGSSREPSPGVLRFCVPGPPTDRLPSVSHVSDVLLVLMSAAVGAGASAAVGILARRTRRQDEAILAARALSSSVVRACRGLDEATNGGRWGNLSLDRHEWSNHGPTLLAGDKIDWANLSSFFSALELLEIDRDLNHDESDPVDDGDDWEYMDLALARGRKAMAEISALAGIDDPSQLLVPEIYGV